MQPQDTTEVILTAREVGVLIEALAQYHINSTTIDIGASLSIEHKLGLSREVGDRIDNLVSETDDDYSGEDDDNG